MLTLFYGLFSKQGKDGYLHISKVVSLRCPALAILSSISHSHAPTWAPLMSSLHCWEQCFREFKKSDKLPQQLVRKVVSNPGLLRQASALTSADRLEGVHMLIKRIELTSFEKGDSCAAKTNQRGDISVLPGGHGSHQWIMTSEYIRTSRFERVLPWSCFLSVWCWVMWPLISWLTWYSWQMWEQSVWLPLLFQKSCLFLLSHCEMDEFRKLFWDYLY